jgi:hypothetical protein
MNDISTNPDHGEHSVQETPAPGARETTQETVTTASIKMMLTQADKQKLRELGHSDEEISHMTPAGAAMILARRGAAGSVAGNGAAASAPHSAQQTPPGPVVAETRPLRPKSVRPNDRELRELADLPIWLCWRYKWRANKKGGGKWDKPPFIAKVYSSEPNWPQMAEADNSSTWRTRDLAMAAYDASQKWRDPFDGVGYVFDGGVDENGECLCGVDLDAMGEAEKELYWKIGPTYAEWSPSGRGVHILAYAKPFGAGVACHTKALNAEAYCDVRFFTFTGARLDSALETIESHPDEVAQIVADIRRTGGDARGTAKTKTPMSKRAQRGREMVARTKADLAAKPLSKEWMKVVLPEWDEPDREPLDLDKLASALSALPDELVATEHTWTNTLSRALANEAMKAGDDPAITQQLYDLLDARSRSDTEGYDEEDNRKRFERCMNEYDPDREVVDADGTVRSGVVGAGTIYQIAEANGWSWRPNGKVTHESNSAAAAPVQPGSGEGVRLQDFVAFMQSNIYIFTPSGDYWPANRVDARVPSVPLFSSAGKPIIDKETKKQIVSRASNWLAKHAPVEQMTWAPGWPQIIRDKLISDGRLDRPQGRLGLQSLSTADAHPW